MTTSKGETWSRAGSRGINSRLPLDVNVMLSLHSKVKPHCGKSDHNVLAVNSAATYSFYTTFSSRREGGAFILVKHCDRIANDQFVDGRRLLFVLSLLVVMFEGPFLSECNRTVQT